MFSSPRATSPERVATSTLPCSAESSDAISLRLASIELAHVEHHLGPPRQVRRPPRRKRRLGDRDRVIDLSRGREVDSEACSPVAGFQTTPDRPDVPSRPCPSTQCEIRFM